jgi:transposase-like protein
MKQDHPSIDVNQIMEGLKEKKPLLGEGGILMPLIKQLSEAMLKAELEAHLETEQTPNRKNGHTTKTIKTSGGTFELNTPRDRANTFEPQLIKKNQTRLSDEVETKVLSLYGLGMSYMDISKHIADMYGLEVSTATISAITDKIIPELEQWRQRPLDPLYPFVWLDAIHYKIREDGRITSKAVYTVLALNMEGKKEILGLYTSATEGAHFWLSVLTDLQQRGVMDILIASVDGLKGFPEAINTIFPKTEVQLCVVHQIRNSLKYVASKHQKAFVLDLKTVYRAETRAIAESALNSLEEKWGQQYAVVIKSWRNSWENLALFFRFPEEIRRVIYTTNAVEAVHRQFRKLTKTKGAFANENGLLKLLYVGIKNASEKWTMPIHNWALTLSQLAIYFEGRFSI